MSVVVVFAPMVEQWSARVYLFPAVAPHCRSE